MNADLQVEIPLYGLMVLINTRIHLMGLMQWFRIMENCPHFIVSVKQTPNQANDLLENRRITSNVETVEISFKGIQSLHF